MPYISEEHRENIHKRKGVDLKEDGELGYAIGWALNRFMECNKPVRYSTFARATGVLVTVLFDFLIRFLAPYEWKKREENGDVYTFHTEDK